MPHTIYLGTGLCQSRLREFDIKNSSYHETAFPSGTTPSASPISDSSDNSKIYRPSLSAISRCMKYSIAELCITLFIVAVFVNSAILIISASSLSEEAGDADLFGMYDLFVSSINQSAGTIFALALLFSGISAGIVATMAGQLIMEGALNWTIRPFYRRLITRCVALIPALVVCAATGRKGVAAALENTNVVLSVALIFLTFPLIWYTSFNKYMMVETEIGVSAVTVDSVVGDVERSVPEGQKISLANNWATMGLGWFIWLLITVMNVATLTFLGLGIGGD
jgi:metal iron transporter